MNKVRSLLVIVASALGALALGELVLRQWGTYLLAPRPPLLASGAILRYVKELPVAPGVDRRWFSEKPPPLPNRTRVDAQMAAQYQEYGKRGLYGPQAFFIWNRRYVLNFLENSCKAGPVFFDNFPADVWVFDPPSGTEYPRFRFPPSQAQPSGLVTNSFGFRGPHLELNKPPKTIRLAFVGASTTVDNHGFRDSYPELVGYWLNRFLASQRSDVKVEIINAGREGIGSSDIAAIVREEVLPLEPDFVVYYEGSNQFYAANLVHDQHGSAHQPEKVPEAYVVSRRLTRASAIARLLDKVITDRASRLKEPDKPRYKLQWPSGLNEFSPDITRPDLPLNLPRILADLDKISASLEPEGGKLVLSSFVWMVEPGMILSRAMHPQMYVQLNGLFWPLTYADMRRLADFQNRVFKAYAEKRGLPFVDVAGKLPKDPDLFSDGIHTTEEGGRLRAWAVLQDLVPILERELQAGRLPRPDQEWLDKHPWMGAPSRMHAGCTVRAAAVQRPPGADAPGYRKPGDDGPPADAVRLTKILNLENIKLADDKASLQRGPVVKVITAPGMGAYAASIPIVDGPAVKVPCWIYVRAQVLKGHVGFGVFSRHHRDFLKEPPVIGQSQGPTDVYISLPSLEGADELIIRSAEEATPSEVAIADVALWVTRRDWQRLRKQLMRLK